jgi:hypothetical protein
MVPELENIFEIASSLPHRERTHSNQKKRKIVFLILREDVLSAFE